MDNRILGLLLIVVGCLVMAGVVHDYLPAISFWAGLAVFPIGGWMVLAGNREAAANAEALHQARLAQRRTPPTSARQDAFAAERARFVSEDGASLERQARAAASGMQQGHAVERDEITLYELDDDDALEPETEFKVSTDVSFPIEVQEQDSLAEQLEKLRRLNEDGILSDEEFAVAKAKLLG